MTSPGGARESALRALIKIDEGSVYAGQARNRVLRFYNLPIQERAFCTKLIFGVTKYKKAIDYVLGAFSSRPVQNMDPIVKNTLRLGVYQILYMREIPDYAAVNESVTLVKSLGHPGKAKFVNAVLRSVSRKTDAIIFPDPSRDWVSHIAVKYSHPEWLVSRWIKRFGPEGTINLCLENNKEARIVVRTNTLKITREDLIKELDQQGFGPYPSNLVDEGIELRNAGGLFNTGLYLEGFFFVQGTASMLVSHVLSPEPGDEILDLTAAPGSKTTHIAELIGDKGRIVACDMHEHRLALIKDNAERLGLSSVEFIRCDSRRLPKDIKATKFDKVLLDAPCSGTGVLRKKADLRWRRIKNDINHIVTLQTGLLESAANQVKPGGILVYSTCSIEPEENEVLISDFLSRHPEFSYDYSQPFLPSGFKKAFQEQGRPYVITYPHIHGTDGFFIARLKHC